MNINIALSETRLIILLIFTLVGGQYVNAQKSYGGTPLYKDLAVATKLIDKLASVDLQDASYKMTKKIEQLPENYIALPLQKKLKTNLNRLQKFHHIDDYTAVQKVRVGESSETYLRLTDFDVPHGARMFIIADHGRQVLGAFTNRNNRKSGDFMCGPIKGDFIIEYTQSSPLVENQLPFEVKDIYVARSYGAMSTGFGASYECMVNINCETASDYGEVKNGVVRIQMVGEQGIALCSGTLLNNTTLDQTPYILTAFHCLRPKGDEPFTPLYDLWYFDFNYEANSCVTPENEPEYVSVQGAEKLAEYEDTDMLLCLISQPIPAEANAYYNGWDRRLDYLPMESALIHHPSGDIKKISQDFDSTTLDLEERAWDNNSVSSPESHFRSDFDDATFQPGSSGAPLFDNNGRVVGQLHGGPRSDEFCTVKIGYFGRLAKSWLGGGDDDSSLKTWLDPTNSGIEMLDGLEASTQNQRVEFNGRIVTPDGIAISNVLITINDDQNTAVFTGTDGRFVFDNLAAEDNFKFTLSRDGSYSNGLSAIDILMITNHILNKVQLPNIYQRRAADVNGDGKISTIDILQIRSIILGLSAIFPEGPSWGFEPQVLEASGHSIGNNGAEFTIIGFKMGDVNFSADPRR